MEKKVRTYRIGIKEIPMITYNDLGKVIFKNRFKRTLSTVSVMDYGFKDNTHFRKTAVYRIILLYLYLVMIEMIKENVAWTFYRRSLMLYIAERNYKSERVRYNISHGRTQVIPFVHQSKRMWLDTRRVYGLKMRGIFGTMLYKEMKSGHRFEMAPMFKNG